MTEDTFPQWLAWRFGNRNTSSDGSWNDVADEDQLYWQHEADAVRRAVARNGFKETGR